MKAAQYIKNACNLPFIGYNNYYYKIFKIQQYRYNSNESISKTCPMIVPTKNKNMNFCSGMFQQDMEGEQVESPVQHLVAEFQLEFEVLLEEI